MDDLPPEDDLKPDTSDRRPPRSRRQSAPAPKLAVPRQYLMIGIGIIVLLLLILGIGSALKSPSSNNASAPSNGPKDISLSGGADSGTATGTAADPVQAPNAQMPATAGQSDVNTAATQPKSIGLPAVSPTPTDAQPAAENGQKERVDLPGDINDALTQQQNQVNDAAEGQTTAGTQSLTSLPTGPATLNGSIKGRAPASTAVAPAPRTAAKAPSAEHRSASRTEHTTPARTPVAKASEPTRKPEVRKEAERPASAPAKAAVESGSAAALKTAPGSHYTLQLSSASQANSLNNFARQQGLKNYYVYQTARDGKPWFVLVSGNYASSAEAKRAIASLPADVQAKKPWVKPVHQVQQDLKK